MVDALTLSGALISSLFGMAWFALAKQAHWQQVRGLRARSQSVRPLYLLGTISLAVSLLLCLLVDHVSMASLVWLMLLTASALLVTFVLAWRPRWLAWLVMWMS